MHEQKVIEEKIQSNADDANELRVPFDYLLFTSLFDLSCESVSESHTTKRRTRRKGGRSKHAVHCRRSQMWTSDLHRSTPNFRERHEEQAIEADTQSKADQVKCEEATKGSRDTQKRLLSLDQIFSW